MCSDVRSMKKIYLVLFFSVIILPRLSAQFSFPGADSIRQYSEQDHKKMLELLHIDSLARRKRP